VNSSISPSQPSGTGTGTGASATDSSRTLRVEAVFRDVDEQHADTIAAEMIGRAHELANLPDWECDVDVSIQLAPSGDDDARDSGAQ
jgi:hypothetical protein